MSNTMQFQPKITNEQTALLPAIEFSGETYIIDRQEDIAEACKYLASHSVIGFDTETKPAFKAGVVHLVSLLQLSTEKVCFLFRLNMIPLDREIIRILESKTTLKIGADVGGDIKCLRQLRHFNDRGFVDLQSIAIQWGIEEKSLRKMSAVVLGERVSKAQRLSNWEAKQLTIRQQLYAATDAWVCVEIYNKLIRTPKLTINPKLKQ